MAIPKALAERLRTGRVVPFAGAGVSMAVFDREAHKRIFPSWSELLMRAAHRLDHESKSNEASLIRSLLKVSKPDFLYAATSARNALGPLWYEFLKDELDPEHNRVDEDSLDLARGMWELGSRLIITTNYDRVLRWACPDANNLESWDIEATAEQVRLLQRGLQRPTVWHLHGRISNAAQMILTLDGYQLLYPEGSHGGETKYKAALETLRQQITSKSLLFVGFSLEDEFFGAQLKAVSEIFNDVNGPHYVLIHEADKDRLRHLSLPVEPITFKGFGSPLIDLLGELAIEGKAHLDMSPSSATFIPVPDYDPRNPVFHVPFRQKGKEILGQEQSLQNVRTQLLEGKRTAIGQTAAFQGLGGLGKTQLAVEYAYRHRGDYPNGVIWINADQDIDAQLIEIAHKGRWIAPASEHKYKLQIAQQRLRSYSDCLIVFDNLDDRRAIDAYLPEPEANPHVLVTSRNDYADFVPVALELLDNSLSVELLIQEARRRPENDAEGLAAQEIARTLGGLPLALELAGAYLSHRPNVLFTQYRDLLLKDLKTALPRSLSSFTEHEADLYKTLKLSEDLLEQESTLRGILNLLTWSGSAPMSAPLISKLVGDPSDADLVNALALGSTLRMLQKSEGSNSYSLHRLVGEVRRGDLKLEEHSDWVEVVCQRLGDWFQERREDFSYLPLIEAEIDHLDTWQGLASQFAQSHASKLKWLQAYPAYHRGRYAESRDYILEAQRMFRELQSTDRELEANLLNDLATTDIQLGLFGSVHEPLKEALAIRQELFGEKHPDIASSLNNIGSYCGMLGDLKTGLEYSEQALAMRLDLFGEKHPDIANSLNNVGNQRAEVGDLKRALEYSQRALAMCLELFGERHPNIASALNNIGSYYGRLGELKSSLEYSEQALSMRRELFGERHPDIAKSLNNVGNLYGIQGDLKRALEYSQQALAMQRELFGEKHPDIATSLNNAGSYYCHQGDVIRALAYSKQALTMQHELFGEKHPDIAISLANVGSYYCEQGNLRAGLEYSEQALAMRLDLFDEKHPDIATSLNNIGDYYGRLGDLEGAVEYSERALAMRRELSGDQHPSTTSSVVQLAGLLIRLNRRAEAYDLITGFLGNLPPKHAYTERLQRIEKQLLSKPLRKGFRQPAKKGKGKKRRR